MKKSIFLFFAAILCAIGMNAAQVTPNGKYFYFKTSSTWNVDGPRYTVYFAWRNGGGEDKTWASCKTVPGTTDILYVTAPGEFWDIYFCRMNGSTTDNKDANVWNKTDKLQYDGSKNFWTKSTGWNGTTSYSTYVPAISSVTLSDNGTSIISGTGTQADPYLVYVETTIKVKGAGTKVLDDPDAKLNYNFKQGTTSKQEGTSATYQFTASATADTEYTINLDGYTKVNTTKSTVTKSATALYYKTVERAEETNTVTISYKCGDKDVQTGITEVVGVSTASSFTAPTVTGYKFTNWTIGAGITLKAGTASDATIAIVTKSASSNYTLVANYEEVMETVYFINTNEWTGTINAYAWTDGTPKVENAGWAGLAATKEDFQIGEYEVYSYTATQGKYANVIFNGSGGQTADLNWTAGKYYIHNYNGNKGWYTQAEAEALLVAPIVYEKVYFVNNKNWSLVQIHAWKDAANNGWPGQALTATGEQVADFDVYSFEAAKGTYTNLLFNNKVDAEGVQSSNYVWTADKYYYMGADANYAGGTAEEVAVLVAPDPLATEVYLAGEMTNKDNWDVNKKEFRKATAEATTASVTVNLTAKTYEFQLVIDGTWYGNKSTMQRGGDAVHEGGWSFEDTSYGANCKIVADIAGDYTFTWNLTDKKLTVAYPPLPKYQVTATAENGSVTGAGEYEQGSEATLVATPDAGYAFKNWTKDSEEVSTEATYTFTVTADVELVANFVPEETHEVTVSYLCGGNPIVGQTTQTLAVGVTTPSTITAPTIKNYKFDSWTLGTGVQSEDATTANPINIVTLASGEYTLTANYTKIELTYTVEVPDGTEKCYIRGGFDGWDKFHEMELKEGETNIFTLTIDGATTEHKYKYACQANWDYKELNADGTDVADRTWNAMDEVKKWAKPDTYTIAGTPAAVFGTEWDANSVANIMRKQDDGTFVWSAKGLVLTTTTEVNFKVVKNQDWNTAWPSSDKVVTIPADGIYNLTIYFNAGEKDDESKNNGIYVNLEAATPDYTRVVDPQYYGTICLPKAGKFVGGSLYEVAYYDETAKKVYFDEVLNGEMEAGMPYVFLANATMIEAYYTNDEEAAAKHKNGLYGTLVDITSGMNEDGVYMIYRNQIIHSTHQDSYLKANRAYIKFTEELPGYNDPSYVAQAPAPGRKRIAMGTTGQNTATGVDQVQGDNVPTKMIINGQLFILRGEKMYDAQGKLVK